MSSRQQTYLHLMNGRSSKDIFDGRKVTGDDNGKLFLYV